MKTRIKLTLLLVLSITFLSPQLLSTEFKITGKITGADGSPPPLSHVHILKSSFTDMTAISTEVKANGAYSISGKKPGLNYLVVTAVNHENLQVPVVFEENTPELKIDMKLAPYDYKDEFDEVKIIGDWNNYSFGSADEMKKEKDESFSYTVEVTADILGYQLLGLISDGRSINGNHADYFKFDGGGDYISYLNVKPGMVRIIFDPDRLIRIKDENLPEVTFHNNKSALEKLMKINRITQSYENSYITELQTYWGTHGNIEGFEFDCTEVKELLMDKMYNEEDLSVRKFSALKLGMLYVTSGVSLDSDVIDYIYQLLPPTSDFYSNYPDLTAYIARNTEIPEKILSAFIEENPDRDVKATALVEIVILKQEKEEMDSSRYYYNRLKSEYGDLEQVQLYLKMINPDKKIVVRKPVPDFEVTLIGNNEKVTNKSLLGKYYIIDFWATWCSPCRREIPHLQKAYDKFKGDDFTILSISLDKAVDDVTKFQKEHKMPWMNAFIEGSFGATLTKKFEVIGIPKPILIDPNGSILAVDMILRGANLEKTLSGFLKE